MADFTTAAMNEKWEQDFGAAMKKALERGAT
jgi:hypothetical protein